MPVFPQRLRTLRQKRNWRQKDVANKLGITESAYGYYEQGRREPSNETLQQLASIFDTSIDCLLGSSDDPSPSRETGHLRSQFPAIADIDPDLLRRFAEAVKGDPFQELFFDNILSASKEEREEIVKELLELRKKYRNRPHPPGDEGPSAWDIIKKK